MKYTIFFSYQSDTKHEYTFIRSALFIAKKSLANEGVEIDVDYSTRNTAGNVGIRETMLTKGSECDIFIADLTYVTKFENDDKRMKSVPNPNVMLELGHSWSQIGMPNCIFVQNTHKGKPEELPVDLAGLRFPILYNLTDNADKDEKREVRNQLASDLQCAITSVVNEINRTNNSKFLPFEKIVNINNARHNCNFIETDYFLDISSEIKRQLNSNRNIILSGKHSIGKSRIILEYANKLDNQELNNVLYCNFNHTNKAELIGVIKRLKDSKKQLLFVIDNCNDDLYANLNDSILYNSNHHAICIINNSAEENAIILDYKEYIYQIFEKTDSDWSIIDKCGYNLTVISAKIFGITEAAERYTLSKEEEEVIRSISMFSKVGFEEQFRVEYDKLCDLFKLDQNRTSDIIVNLVKEGYIIEKGGFIYVESNHIAVQYAKDVWDRYRFNDVKFESLDCLQEWFVNRQVDIAGKNAICNKYLKSIVKKFFREIEFIDNENNSYIPCKLSELFSEEVVVSFEILLERNPEHIFKSPIGVIWALDNTLKVQNLFNRTILILLNMSQRNNDSTCDIKQHIVSLFISRNGEFHQNINFDIVETIYKQGHTDIVQDIFNNIYRLNWKSDGDKNKMYLTESFEFLLEIRASHTGWVNDIIINNIRLARYLGLSRRTYATIREIIKQDATQIYHIADTLRSQVKWADPKDRVSINRLLQSISKNHIRARLYIEVILYKFDYPFNKDAILTYMKEVAERLTLDDIDISNYLDVFILTDRKYDSQSMWFAYALGSLLNNTQKLINSCLTLIGSQSTTAANISYEFARGLYSNFCEQVGDVKYKQERDKLLQDPKYIDLAIAISNNVTNTIEDVEKIKDALICNNMELSKLDNICTLSLSIGDYINLSKNLATCSGGYSASLHYLKILEHYETEISKDKIKPLKSIILNHSEWITDSDFIKMVELYLKRYNNPEFACLVIKKLIDNYDNRHFNHNCCLVDLSDVLISNYQELYLKEIEALLTNDEIYNYWKLQKLKSLLIFKNNASNSIYVEWVDKIGVKAAEFVVKIMQLFNTDEDTELTWNDEALYIMRNYSDGSYVLNNISTRLYNGLVSTSKYARNKAIYNQLCEDENSKVRIWAIEQCEWMEKEIDREIKNSELHSVYYR